MKWHFILKVAGGWHGWFTSRAPGPMKAGRTREAPDRATVEMRRLAYRFPDTPDAKRAVAELHRRELELQTVEGN